MDQAEIRAAEAAYRDEAQAAASLPDYAGRDDDAREADREEALIAQLERLVAADEAAAEQADQAADAQGYT